MKLTPSQVKALRNLDAWGPVERSSSMSFGTYTRWQSATNRIGRPRVPMYWTLRSLVDKGVATERTTQATINSQTYTYAINDAGRAALAALEATA